MATIEAVALAVATAAPELFVVGIVDDGNRREESLRAVVALAKLADVALIGPGLRDEEAIRVLLPELLGLDHLRALIIDANIAFIGFYRAMQLLKAASFHGGTNAMRHKPSGFLRDSKGAMHFVRTNAVLGVKDQRYGSQPFAKANRAILKNTADLDGKLVVSDAIPADPKPTRFDLAQAIGTTTRTRNAVWPAHLSHKLMGAVGIGKLLNTLNQSLRKTVYRV